MNKPLVWKVCRVRDLSTARLCADLGADLLGLHAIYDLSDENAVIYSRIIVELEQYYQNARAVLVTRSTSSAQLAWFIERTGVRTIQLHVPVSPEEIAALAAEIRARIGSEPRFIAVVAAKDAESVYRVQALQRAREFIDFLLIDSDWRGGTGQVSIQYQFRMLLDASGKLSTLLAGGLDTNNVVAAIEQFRPDGIDVQSRLELDVADRPKDPMKLVHFSQLIKSDVVATGYRTPPRRLISLSLSDVPAEVAESIICQFRQTDIDLVHIDHSDGSMTPLFVRSPTYIAAALRHVAPCIPYDIHLFVRLVDSCRSILTQYLMANPLLRIAFIHIDTSGPEELQRIQTFVSITRDLKIGAGIALFAPNFDVDNVREMMSHLRLISVLEVLLVTHSASYSLAETSPHDQRLLAGLRMSARKSCIRHIGVDRDITADKLSALAVAQPSHAVVGRYLHSSTAPQERITELRHFLALPLP